MNQLLAFAQLAPLFALHRGKWTGIRESGDGFDEEVACAGDVYARRGVEVRSTEVSIQCDCPVDCRVRPDQFSRREVLNSVSEEVRMRVPKHEWAELHHGDKPREIHDLCVGVSSIHNARKVEQLRALVDLCPESLLKGFFGVTLGG